MAVAFDSIKCASMARAHMSLDEQERPEKLNVTAGTKM